MSDLENIHPRTDYESHIQPSIVRDLHALKRDLQDGLIGKQNTYSSNRRVDNHIESNLVGKDIDSKYGYVGALLNAYLIDLQDGKTSIDPFTGMFTKNFDVNQSKILNRVSEAFDALFVKLPDFEKLQEAYIDRGILRLAYFQPPMKERIIYHINLQNIFSGGKNGKPFVLNGEKLDQYLQSKLKTSPEVQSSIRTETLFDGAVKIVYQSAQNSLPYLGLAGVPTTLYNTGNYWKTAGKQGKIKNLFFLDPATKQYLPAPQGLVTKLIRQAGEKTKIDRLIFKVMAESGKVFNVTRKAFTSLEMAAIDRAAASLSRMKYDPKKFLPDIRTPQEFEARKLDLSLRIEKAIGPRPIEALMKGIPVKMIEFGFWGVFFTEYRKNYEDQLALYKGFGEAGVFTAGAKLGSRIPLPGGLRSVAGLAGGIGALSLAHWLSPSDIDKKLWRIAPNRFTGNGEKSLVEHVVTGTATHDLLDKVGTDFGIPGTRGGARIAGGIFGKDQILPDVSFARTTIDFGTHPREYLTSRIAPTDSWNDRIDEFVGTETEKGYLVPQIMNILSDYRNNRGLFRASNVNKYTEQNDIIARKNAILRERLGPLIGSGGSSSKRTQGVIEDCIRYVTESITQVNNPKEQERLLQIFFQNYGNVLKIDEDSIKFEEQLLEKDTQYINTLTSDFVSQIGGEKGRFSQTCFKRLLRGENIITMHEIEVDNLSNPGLMPGELAMMGATTTISVPDKGESTLYKSLIDDKTPLTKEQIEIMGLRRDPEFDHPTTIFIPSNNTRSPGRYVKNTDGKIDEVSGKTRGDYFCYLLGTLAEFRTQTRYIKNAKTIGYANGWKI